MNKLLSYNPEPFESDSELEGAFQEYDAEGNGSEGEAEFEFGRSRSRSPYSRPKSARPPRVYAKPTRQQPRLKPDLVKAGLSKPPTLTSRLPFLPLKPPYHRFPRFPIVPPAWPQFPIPEKPEPPEPRGAGRPGGEPSGGQPPEQEPREAPSEYVRWVQSCLNQVMGLRLPLDGIMSAATRSALRLFQERKGLPVNGLIGPATERALMEACSAQSQPPTMELSGGELILPSPITNGEPSMRYQTEFKLEPFQFHAQGTNRELLEMEQFEYLESEVNRNSPNFIRWVQESLNKVLRLKLKVDGIMSPQTRSAIRTFQQKRKLSVDGVAGPATIRALINVGAASPPSGVIATDTIVRADARLDGFDFDKSDLKSSHAPEIDRIANRIVQSWRSGKPFFTVRVIGHTDPEGSAQHNQALGLRRALAVRSALQNALKKKQKDLYYKVLVLASSKGEFEPIDNSNTPQGQARNRRVEIFLSTKALLPLPSPPTPKPEPIKPVPLIWPDINFPHPIPPEPPLCDLPVYEARKRRCYDEALSAIGGCAKQFVTDMGPVLAAAVSVIGTVYSTLKVPALAVVLGIVGGLGTVVIPSARNQYRVAKCIYDNAVRLRDCLERSRRDTNCL